MIFRELAQLRLSELFSAWNNAWPVVFIQGLALTEWYGDALLRPMTDVDLLLPHGGAEEFRRLLESKGAIPFGDYRNTWDLGGLQIDLHEDLWAADRLPGRAWCAPSISAEFLPSRRILQALVPAPRLLFLHAVFHGVKHGFSRLVWDADLLLLHTRGFSAVPPGDKATVYDAIARARLRRIWGIDMGESGVPRDVVRRGRFIESLVSRYTVEGTGEMALALCCPRLHQRFAYLWASALPPRRVLAQMYGDAPYAVLLLKRAYAMIMLLLRAMVRR